MIENDTQQDIEIPSFRSPSSVTYPMESFGLAPLTALTLERLMKGQVHAQILLVGPQQCGKSALAHTLVELTGRAASVLVDRRRAIKALESVLSDPFVGVIVDDADDLLSCDSPFAESLPKAFFQDFLGQHGVPQVWVTTTIDEIPAAVLNLFDLVVEMEPLKSTAYCWPEVVPHEWREELQAFESWSRTELDHTVDVWRRSTCPEDTEVESKTLLLHLLGMNPRASAKALPSASRSPALDYDLSLTNTDLDLSELENMGRKYLDWLDGHPGESQAMAMLAYGAPGTGKTAWVSRLAAMLDLTLFSVTYADVVSPMVGVTEKNLATTFRQSRSRGALLFLDEIDSLLVNRATAKASWEVSQTNQLLVELQRHRGIVCLATNRQSELDEAVSRRLVAKVQFAPLRSQQLGLAWTRFFPGIEAPADLASLGEGLTAGDFKIVADFFKFRTEEVRSQDILIRLKKELEAKSKFGNRNVRPIGFRG